MLRDGTMTILRGLLGGAVIVLCAGFIPTGACAKGCSQAGRAGASHADDFARIGTRGAAHYGDDIARGAGKYGRGAGYADDLAAAGRYRAGAGYAGAAGHVDEVATTMSRSGMEHTIAALPETEGAVVAMARKPTPSGAKLEGLDDAGRTFGKDYGKSIDDLAISEKQHEQLMDAFETAQDIAGEVIDALSDEGEEDPDKIVASYHAREKLQMAAYGLEMKVNDVLSGEQREKFWAQHGSAQVVTYRIGKDKPVQKVAKKPTPTKKAAGSDKVAP